MAGIEQINMGTLVSITENDDCRISVFRNETGEGVITSYEILDGIYLLLSDFHMQNMVSEMRHMADLFCLDYCCEGRAEWTLVNGTYLYQQSGDLSIDDRTNAGSNCHLPLDQYHAVSIAFFMPQAAQSIQRTFADFPVDINKLKERFTSQPYPYLLRNDSVVSRIFEDIKDIREPNRKIYIIIKIFELLVYLDSTDMNNFEPNNEYFYKSHVLKVKKMHEMMINDLEHHYTLDELSQEFDIPLTPMTKCFKGVYGKAIYSYIRTLRITQAAKQIMQTDVSIADAALSVGYSNPSKFSSAFRSVLGKLPTEYRKQKLFNHKEK